MLLVRHGRSEWNEDGRWQGWADPPLSEMGRRQAEMAGASLALDPEVDPFDAIVCSDLDRARETAALLAERLGVSGVAVDAGFKERSVGQWAGLTTPEIEAGWPGMISQIVHGAAPPGGESLAEFVPRVLAAIDRVATAHPHGAVLTVAHGGVIRNLERHLGVDTVPCPNLAGAWITIDPDPAVPVERRMTIGPRILLVDPDDVALSAPGRL